MAEKTDDKAVSGDDRGASQDEKQAPVSVRDSIRAAVEEHTQEDVKEDRKPEKEPREVDDSSALREVKKDTKEASEITIKDKKETVVPDEKEAQVSTTKDVESREKAPTFIPKEVQTDWNHVPQSARDYITKINNEKAELGRRASQYKDMDAVIAPYMPALQQWGVTPAQTIDKLFQWMGALTGQHKYEAIQELAYNFGIDLESLYAPVDNQQQANNQNQPQDQATQQNIDPTLINAMQAMYDEVHSLKQAQSQQKQASAANFVDSWAGAKGDGTFTKKPYFPQVRQVMFSLLSSGVIPLVNGNLDLDTAYEQACYSNPEVRQALLAEQEEEKQAKLKEAREKKAAEDRAKVAKARAASASLKPSSPTGNLSSNSKVNNRSSVRDSIYSAIREVNN